MGNCLQVDDFSYILYEEKGKSHEIIPADVIFYCIECKEYFQGHDEQYEHREGWICDNNCEHSWLIRNMSKNVEFLCQPLILNEENI